MFENAIKKVKEMYGEQEPVSRGWLVFLLLLIGQNIDKSHTESAKESQRFADSWDRCIENIIRQKK